MGVPLYTMPPQPPQEDLLSRVGRMGQLRNLIGQRDVQQARIQTEQARVRNIEQQRGLRRVRQIGEHQENIIRGQSMRDRENIFDIINKAGGRLDDETLNAITQVDATAGQKLSEGVLANRKTNIEIQKANLEYVLAQGELKSRLLRGVYDEPSKFANIAEGVRRKVLTEAEADKLRMTPHDDKLFRFLAKQSLTEQQIAKAESVLLSAKQRDFNQWYPAWRTANNRKDNAKSYVDAWREFNNIGRGGSSLATTLLQSIQSGSPEFILSQLDPLTRANVLGIVRYELNPKSLASIRGHRREYLIGLARLVDPSFDMSQYPARAALRRDFTSGKGAQNLRSLNTAIGHLDSLRKAADGLDNASSQTWNKIINLTLSEVGDPRVVKFNTAMNAVAGEMATIFKNTSGTDQEIKSWREQLNSSQSPEQVHGAIAQLIDLMASRMEALSGQWTAGMGRPRDFRFLNPKSEAILREAGATAMLELDRIGSQSVTTTLTPQLQCPPGMEEYNNKRTGERRCQPIGLSQAQEGKVGGGVVGAGGVGLSEGQEGGETVETITMISPNGQSGEIPVENVGRALQKGFTLPPSRVQEPPPVGGGWGTSRIRPPGTGTMRIRPNE